MTPREKIISCWNGKKPDHVPLFEDNNIPHGTELSVSKPDDVPIYLCG